MEKLFLELRKQLETLMRDQDPIEHKRITEKMLSFPSAGSWHTYPVLPLIRKFDKNLPLSFENVIHGFVFATSVNKVCIGSIYERPEKVAEYSSLKEVIEDGWFVDF